MEMMYHEIIAIFQRYRTVEIGEEDVLRILERPLHGSELRRRCHFETVPLPNLRFRIMQLELDHYTNQSVRFRDSSCWD